jgi:hypothetical protein
MPDYTNLPDLLTIEKDYLNNLQGRTADPTVGGLVANLSSKLDALKNNYKSALANNNATLTQQDKINQILETENTRLTDKKTSIQQALDGQQRIVSLNDSYRLKYAQYIKMLLVIIIALVIWVILSKLNSIGLLPDAIYTILIILVLVIPGFICYFIYLDILGRDRMNFNELNIPPPDKLTPDQIRQRKEAAAKDGDLLGSINFAGCVGSECCSDGTKWDEGNSVCFGNSLAFGRSTTFNGFSTISVSYKNGEFLPPTTPNSPDEFTQYSKV